MASQDRGWFEWLDRTDEELQLLSPEGRRFVAAMRQNLEASFGEVGEYTGPKVTNAFRRAVMTVLSERGIEHEDPPASVVLVPGIDKKADFSFRVAGVHWVVEVKSGLEFNSLGAALLEGVLFQHREPDCRFVLLSLYSKMKATPDQLVKLLTDLGLGHGFYHIVVFTLNSEEKSGAWWKNAARRINDFFCLVPIPDDRGSA
jgi:hypothetical protein